MPRTSEPGYVLLDTHTWLWLVEGGETLALAARVTGAVLLPRDRRILDYAAGGNLTALPA